VCERHVHIQVGRRGPQRCSFDRDGYLDGRNRRAVDTRCHSGGVDLPKKILAFVLLSACLACAAPKIDTTTDDSMKKSIERVRQALPEEKRADFDNAVRELALADLDFRDLMAQGQNPAADVLTSKMKQRLNGKTGEQILADAAKLREETERKQREQAVAEIAELQKKQADAAAARQKLAAFHVTRSRFYMNSSGFMDQPVIELSVTNGTKSPVSRAYFHGVVATPGRSVPWISEDFNYAISGGLEPGESATWKLNPNMFSGWGTKTPSDAVFTVDVVKLDGPDGKTLYDAEGLDDSEQRRLAELKSKFSRN